MGALRKEIAVIDLLKFMKNKQPAVRRQAAKALAQEKLETSLALRQFRKVLADPDPAVRVTGVKALSRLGVEGVALLAEALADPEPSVRREAAWALGQIGPDAAAAVPALARALDDPDRKVCQGAIRALGVIGRRAYPAIPALIALLEASHLVLCRMAASALAQIGSAAVPALVDAVQSGDLYVRCEAVWALGKMGREARSAVLSLAGVLRDRGVRCPARSDSPTPEEHRLEPTVPVFIQPRRNSEDRFWAMTITALGEIGPDAKGAVPVLLPLLQDGDGTIQVLASRVLKQIDPEAYAARPTTTTG